jgi:serine/threonine protein kinase
MTAMEGGRDHAREARFVRAEQLLEELLANREVVPAVDLDALIAAHPDLEVELRELHAGCAEVREALQEHETRRYDGPVRARRPERIGRYHVLDELGEGGMGRVFLAEQREPFRRRVAVKVIRAGRDDEVYLRRFKAERQALATMEHNAIAKVFDAGETDDGQPYFAMEHVPGLPITVYCDRHRLPIAARLELLRKVCDGIQHAHEKGILHRDLKPSNILVAVQGGEAVPKIIDFGVARATDHRLHDGSFTEAGLPLGTPEYMSPEQVSGLDVDARTDVFALGVLLYELVAGDLPFRSKPGSTDMARLTEMRRKICEEDPSPPSTALTRRLPADSAAIAAQRASALPDLVRELRGGLDWIVLRALEKDRTRRYATAAELGDDLGRCMRNEPLIAAPPSLVYQMRKLAWRHRHRLVAGGAVLLAVALGVLALTYPSAPATFADWYRNAPPEEQTRFRDHPDLLKLALARTDDPGQWPRAESTRSGAALWCLAPRAMSLEPRPAFRFALAEGEQGAANFEVSINGPIGQAAQRERVLRVAGSGSSTLEARLEDGDALAPGDYLWRVDRAGEVDDSDPASFRIATPAELAATTARAPRTGNQHLDAWLRVAALLEAGFAAEALAELEGDSGVSTFAGDPQRRLLFRAMAYHLLGRPEEVERLRTEALGR